MRTNNIPQVRSQAPDVKDPNNSQGDPSSLRIRKANGVNSRCTPQTKDPKSPREATAAPSLSSSPNEEASPRSNTSNPQELGKAGLGNDLPMQIVYVPINPEPVEELGVPGPDNKPAPCPKNKEDDSSLLQKDDSSSLQKSASNSDLTTAPGSLVVELANSGSFSVTSEIRRGTKVSRTGVDKVVIPYRDTEGDKRVIFYGRQRVDTISTIDDYNENLGKAKKDLSEAIDKALSDKSETIFVMMVPVKRNGSFDNHASTVEIMKNGDQVQSVTIHEPNLPGHAETLKELLTEQLSDKGIQIQPEIKPLGFRFNSLNMQSIIKKSVGAGKGKQIREGSEIEDRNCIVQSFAIHYALKMGRYESLRELVKNKTFFDHQNAMVLDKNGKNLAVKEQDKALKKINKAKDESIPINWVEGLREIDKLVAATFINE